MATDPPAQRVYRADCPNCGAPVEFRSAASASAVCSFCRSTLLRDGDALRRIGQSAELFDDHSPLRLNAAGRYQGEAFQLVGRRQMGYLDGVWNEWHALFDNGRSGWLSEDNGAYVFGFDAPWTDAPPATETWRPGERRQLAGRAWSVASVVRARAIAAEGELPTPPRLDGGEWTVVDLRSTGDEVATLELADPSRPQWSIGRAVALSSLALSGLADASEKTLSGRALACPNCGASLAPTLDSTKTVVCAQCASVVDISAGPGADLAFYRQDNPQIEGGTPPLPLGAMARLALGGEPQAWQVVGYVERTEVPDDPDDERVVWREYLLYHRTEGFAFLVDADDGWSWARPITGVPQAAGDAVEWRRVRYARLYRYTGVVTHVLGEFYWRLKRDERTRNVDYRGRGAESRKRLNREETDGEVVWSAGEVVDASVIARAFGLDAPGRLDRGTPVVAGDAAAMSGLGKGVLLLLLVVVAIVVLVRCSGGDDCADLRETFGADSNEYRQCARSGGGGGGFRSSGGAFGGYSSGGGHK